MRSVSSQRDALLWTCKGSSLRKQKSAALSFLVYFSGHGVAADGDLMLILDDTDRSKPLTTGFYGRYLMTAMNSCHAKRKILILDCCNAGTFTTLIGLKASEEPPITELGINPQQSTQ